MNKMAHPDWPYTCDRYCKVHWYWNFETRDHEPLPNAWNIKREAGWVRITVHVGPPGYFPKKPTYDESVNMRMTCPHKQIDLTCNTCLRHTFRPMEI